MFAHCVSPGPWLCLDTDCDVCDVPFTAEVLVDQIKLLSYSLELSYTVNPEYNHEQFISCVELIKRNAAVTLTDPSAQSVVNSIATRLDEVPELVSYTEDFKRRCLKSHRDAARKRFVSFYFSRCEDLCDDVIEKVLSSI